MAKAKGLRAKKEEEVKEVELVEEESAEESAEEVEAEETEKAPEKEEAKAVDVKATDEKKEVAVPKVRVKPNQDIKTYIGNQWYNLKKGKQETVPATVKTILQNAGLLDAL